MLLCIDIGNSRTKIGLFVDKAEKPKNTIYITTSLNITADELYVEFESSLRSNKIDVSKIRGCSISCVVPSITQVWLDTINKLSNMFNTNIEVVVCEPKIAANLSKDIYDCRYPLPNEVGGDFIAASIAAKHKFGSNCIVMDYGTATNVTILDKNGSFIGGLILPGLNTSIKALIQDASALSAIEIKKPEHIIGQNTTEAIQSGLYYGEISRIEGLYKKIQSSLGNRCSLVITGGLSFIARESLNCDALIDPNFILFGLKVFYESLNR